MSRGDRFLDSPSAVCYTHVEVIHMPRSSRKPSATGYYHIIIRGVNRQSIVQDDQDRSKMVDTLRKYAADSDTRVLAYCLMDNHLHLLIQAAAGPAMFVKKVASSYVYYFNHKYDRIGHLFQDRYKSEAVDTEEYLLTVARYILQNPLKAGICGVKKYAWSSWKDIATGEGFCDTELLCECMGGRAALVSFCLAPSSDRCLDTSDNKTLKDKDALRMLQQICGSANPQDIAMLPRPEQKAILIKAKAKGLSVRQLSRLTGLDRNIVQRA